MTPVILKLNSHQLSDFQQCFTRGNYSTIRALQTPVVQQSPGLSKGTLWHTLMQYRSLGRMRKKPYVPINACCRAIKRSELDALTQVKVYTRLIDYNTKYSQEWWTPQATEVGFSKILWQAKDKSVTFIYEGRIDLLANFKDLEIVVDHKTQHPAYSSDKHELYPYNNQFLGYSWATGRQHLIVDYTTWSDKITDRTFRRRGPYKFTQDQVNAWKAETITWYWKILEATRFSNYSMNRSACEGKYGLCPFSKLCEVPHEETREAMIRNKYIQGERRESW